MKTNDLKKEAILASRGDKHAFGRLYDVLFDRIYKFVFFRVDSREEAEDITEETFVKVWDKIKTYKDVGVSFEAWVYRIARNTLIDTYRTKKITESIDTRWDIVDDKPTPEDLFLENEQLSGVYNSLKDIKANYAEVIVLKYINDLEYSEIAEILGKPQDQVRVLLSRATKALKQKVNEKTRN